MGAERSICIFLARYLGGFWDIFMDGGSLALALDVLFYIDTHGILRQTEQGI